MTKVEIFYFSGTGNSLVIARSLAEKLGARLTPIVPLLKSDRVETEADAIGLVFPIYGMKPPRIIEAFIKKLPNLNSKYVFAVATYGFLAQKALKKLDLTLKSCGGKLSAGALVRMPLNGTINEKVTTEQVRKMAKKGYSKFETFDSLVASRQSGRIETTNVFKHLILNGQFVKAVPRFLSLMGYILLHGSGSAFVADEHCIGCGTCERVCPMDNIILVDKRPLWGKNCIHCSACLQWCPNQAVQAGTYTINKSRYHHPDITVIEIINQKQLSD